MSTDYIGMVRAKEGDKLDHGVKGMKWGIRNDQPAAGDSGSGGSASKSSALEPLKRGPDGFANRKPTDDEIKGARQRQLEKKAQMNALDEKYGKTEDGKYFVFSNEHAKLLREMQDGFDRTLANYSTSAERRNGLLLGGVPGAYLAGNSKARIISRNRNSTKYV